MCGTLSSASHQKRVQEGIGDKEEEQEREGGDVRSRAASLREWLLMFCYTMFLPTLPHVGNLSSIPSSDIPPPLY